MRSEPQPLINLINFKRLICPPRLQNTNICIHITQGNSLYLRTSHQLFYAEKQDERYEECRTEVENKELKTNGLQQSPGGVTVARAPVYVNRAEGLGVRQSRPGQSATAAGQQILGIGSDVHTRAHSHMHSSYKPNSQGTPHRNDQLETVYCAPQLNLPQDTDSLIHLQQHIYVLRTCSTELDSSGPFLLHRSSMKSVDLVLQKPNRQ